MGIFLRFRIKFYETLWFFVERRLHSAKMAYFRRNNPEAYAELAALKERIERQYDEIMWPGGGDTVDVDVAAAQAYKDLGK